ncbi:MAG: prepilin-type N-terminal cleavage/methylation domain-containing protein [Verrucomicrobia bacterium]|nr:prepilin-type N-terminal cleavage/methylation domain-containing protein [Verrucomicrobiota bacterium]
MYSPGKDNCRPDPGFDGDAAPALGWRMRGVFRWVQSGRGRFGARARTVGRSAARVTCSPRGGDFVWTDARPPAFSLIELLLVLAVVAVLGGLALPAGRRALEFGRVVRTQALFAQWRAALEGYRAEYGAYPEIAAGGLLESELLAGALTGRDSLGREALADGLNGNLRRLRFLEPAASDWLRLDAPATRAVVVDAFGNSDIAVLYDRDGDGWIRGEEAVLPPLRPGNAREGFGEPITLAGAGTLRDSGVRARIAFVTVGAGDGREPMCSWRD